jgi:hypothetical protein
MLSLILSITNINKISRKSTPWGVSVIIISGMPIAICDKYLDSIGENYDPKTRSKKSVEKPAAI